MIALPLVLVLLLSGGCSGMSGGFSDPELPPTSGDEYSNDFDFYAREASGDTSEIVIKAAPNTVKIKRDADISSFAEKVNIRGARNENEAFQVIPMPGTVASLSGVMIGVSDLSSTEGDFFSRENFTYFLEEYVYCPVASDSGGDTGWFPDPLVPISDPFDINTIDGLKPVWINCYIPPGTPPGVYTGNVVVTAYGGLIESIPLRLKVLDFTLGDGFQLKTAFGLNRECVNSYHGYPEGENGVEVDNTRTLYADTLMDRGVSFWGFDWFKPSYRINFDDTVDVDFTSVEYRFDKYFSGVYNMNAFQFPLRVWDLLYGQLAIDVTVGDPIWRKRVKSYITACSEWMENKGVLDRGFMFVIDEPKSVTDYNNVRYIGALVQEVSPRPRFLVTEQAYSSNLDGWGSLLGYVDIFCPAIQLAEPYGGVDPDDPYNNGTYEFENWIYTNTNVYPFPGYAIDHPSLEPRLIAWLCYLKDLKGVLYWSANYWKMTNPWDDPYTLGDPIYGAGNGCLLYPGGDISLHTDQADVEGPISSIRLEMIREGLEDYEYLMAIGGGNEIPEIEMIISDYDKYMTNGQLFYKLRNMGTEYFFGGS